MYSPSIAPLLSLHLYLWFHVVIHHEIVPCLFVSILITKLLISNNNSASDFEFHSAFFLSVTSSVVLLITFLLCLILFFFISIFWFFCPLLASRIYIYHRFINIYKYVSIYFHYILFIIEKNLIITCKIQHNFRIK